MKMEKTISGLEYEIRKQTSGAIPRNGQLVSVHYMVSLTFETLEDGPWLDSSYDRGNEFKFRVGQGEVIKGVDEGISLMKILELCWFSIPSELAFGKRGIPNLINPNTRIFVALYLMSILD